MSAVPADLRHAVRALTRVALGARAADVVRLVLRQSLVVASIGVAAGVAAALATTHFLEALLFGVAPNDASTLWAVAAGLAAVALLASAAPALRAGRLDPSRALRVE